MSQRRHSVMLCDSGVGGLSICPPLLAAMPDVHISYLADFDGFPYGSRTEQSLRDRVLSLVTPLMDEVQPDVLVVACNTASTLLLPDLRACLKIPVVGVVPAIKPAAAHSLTKKIGLLATPATVTRAYIDQLVADFAPDALVIKVGSSRLVELAEDWLFGRPVDREEIKTILLPFFLHQDVSLDATVPLDTIVLGCTHFPLVKELLAEAADELVNRPISWQDSGEAVARRVASLLPASSTRHSIIRSHRFLYTGQNIPEVDIRGALQRIGLEGFCIEYTKASGASVVPQE